MNEIQNKENRFKDNLQYKIEENGKFNESWNSKIRKLGEETWKNI